MPKAAFVVCWLLKSSDGPLRATAPMVLTPPVSASSERVDLLDAEEPIWAFGAPSCVGNATNLQLRPLGL